MSELTLRQMEYFVAVVDHGSVTAAAAAFTDTLGQIRGPLRVGCSQTLSPRLVPPLAEYFTKHHPEVDLRFTESSAGAVQEGLREGRLDVALVYALQADDDLDRELIKDIQLQVVLPQDHRLASRSTVRLQDIAAEPAILLDVPPTIERLTTVAR